MKSNSLSWIRKAIAIETAIAFLILLGLCRAFSQPILEPRLASFRPEPQKPFHRGILTVSWKAPTNMTDVRGFIVTWGTNLPNNSTEVGRHATNIVLRGLAELQRYKVTLCTVASNGATSDVLTNSAITQPHWQHRTHSTAFETLLQAGRTNIVESSTNGGGTWRAIQTNTAGGIVTIIRTNGIGSSELFRVR